MSNRHRSGPRRRTQAQYDSGHPSGSNTASPAVPNTPNGPRETAYLGGDQTLSVPSNNSATVPNHQNRVGRIPVLAAPTSTDLPSPNLLQCFCDAFFEYGYAFCPILERSSVLKEQITRSPLLTYAIALAGSCLCPPLIEHAGPESYYAVAKFLFYSESEPGQTTCLAAIALLYWHNPNGPTIVNYDSIWWWTGIGIRHAQQMGLHQDPWDERGAADFGPRKMKRRLWWTFYVCRVW
jgi:hypothetical protein